MKPETILALVALGAVAFFATRARARRPSELESRRPPSGPILAGFTGAAPPKAPTPKGTIKKGAAPGAQAPPEYIPYEADDQSAYLQPIGSCELGSGISGTLYLNQFGEEVCA